MPTRYTGWFKRAGEVDPSPAALDVGKKLLGEIDTDRRLGGPPTQVRRQTLADGTVVTARTVMGVPQLRIETPPHPVRPQPVDVAGFVAWPTTLDNADSLPEGSPRALFAGHRFHVLLEKAYKRLFAGTDLDADGTPDIPPLGRAGNVDWHGKDGWALSWYGPATRYLEYSAADLSTGVFYKGKAILSAYGGVFNQGGTNRVRGAAIGTFGGAQWLIVAVETVYEVYNPTDFIYAVRIAEGDPKAPTLTLSDDPDDRVLLVQRSNKNVDGRGHPYCFNPTGTEARMICQPRFLGPSEVILTLREAGAGQPPTASFATVALAGPTSSTAQGLTAGVYGAALANITLARTLDVTYPPPGHTEYPASHGVTYTEAVPLTQGTLAIGAELRQRYFKSYTRQDDQTPGVTWQPVAVDYTAKGEVVYGYARSYEQHRTTQGGTNWSISPSSASVTTLSATLVSQGVWNTGGGYTWSYDISAPFQYATTGWTATMAQTQSVSDYEAFGGFKVGETAFVAEATRVTTTTGAGSVTAAAYTSPAGISYLAPTAFVDNGGSGGYVFRHYRNVGQPEWLDGAAFASQTVTASRETVEHGVSMDVYLLAMDLRYGLLAVAVREYATDLTESTSTSLTFGSSDTGGFTGTETQTQHVERVETWRFKAWIRNKLVLDEAVATPDPVIDTSSTVAVGSGGAARPYVNGVDAVLAIAPPYGATDNSANSGAYGAACFVKPPGTPTDMYGAGTNPFGPFAAAAPGTFRTHTSPGPAYAPGASVDNALITTVEALPARLHPGSGDVGFFGTVKNRWHTDADGRLHMQAWRLYQGEWIYSLSLPVPTAAPAFAYRAASSKGEPIAKLKDADTAFLHPVWILAPTRGLIPPE